MIGWKGWHPWFPEHVRLEGMASRGIGIEKKGGGMIGYGG